MTELNNPKSIITSDNFDIVVIGGGHAGIEAAYLASSFNHLSVALVTMPGVAIGSAPCNPSIGGIGKGHITREIAALGGAMGKLADLAGIQFRYLNESKGQAVRSTRVQIDKDYYPKFALELLQEQKNLSIIYAKADRIDSSNHEIIREVQNTSQVQDCSFYIFTSNSLTQEKRTLVAKRVIITIGTFTQGKLHQGANQSAGGRLGSDSSSDLGDFIKQYHFRGLRFKTGTPARLYGSSIDTTVLEAQESDPSVFNFSFDHQSTGRHLPQRSCFITRIEQSGLDIIVKNKELSPMYNGQIYGTGARYCPSIEDKAFRYPEKSSHQVFLEPETSSAETYYPSGLSSSLPCEVQESFLKTIKGLEQVSIQKYGYAVEYDVVDTTTLNLSLESKMIPGLYFAGQVNGTSGYEEAAAQGVVTGINAGLSLCGALPLYFRRTDSYIGILVEDLVSNLRDEPYRLFTARSEYRLVTREDNAFIRMASYRKIFSQQMSRVIDQYLDQAILEWTFLTDYLQNQQQLELYEQLKSPLLDPFNTLRSFLNKVGLTFDERIIYCVANDVKYSGYIKRFERENSRKDKIDSRRIRLELILASNNVSYECKQRIAKVAPDNFGQLKRIAGLRVSSIAAIANDLI